MPEQNKQMNKHKTMKYLVVALAAIAAIVIVVMALGRSVSANTQPTEEKVFKVTVEDVVPTGNAVYAQYTGLIQPATITQCTFGTLGIIDKIYVSEGDEVAAGQLLASMDPGSAQNQQVNMQQLVEQTDRAVASAQRALDDARRDYDKACQPADPAKVSAAREERDQAKTERDEKKVEADRYTAQMEEDKKLRDEAKARYETARAPIEEAQKKLDAAEQTLTEAQSAETEAQTLADTAAAELAAAQEKLSGLQAAEQKDEAAIQQAQQEVTAAEQKLEEANAALITAQQTKASACEARDRARMDRDTVKAKIDLETLPLADELAKAEAKLVQSQALATGAQTHLVALESKLAAKQAAYDLLEGKGSGSPEAEIQRQRMDAAANALSLAQSAQISARNSMNSVGSSMADYNLKAPSDGTVIKIVGSEGGMGTPIAPTVVLGSKRSTVQFGVSQTDVRRITEGSEAVVTVEGEEYPGVVTSIGTMPDPTTRTYMVNVDIVSDSEKFYLGEMAQVKLDAGQRTGAWLPLSCVLNDGEDYVYVVENDRAVRRVVSIRDVSDDKVLLDGLEGDSRVIVEGMKTVRSGSAVIAD